MSRYLAPLALCIAVMAPLAQAADTAPQRLAMANTGDSVASKSIRHVAQTERAATPAKQAARRTTENRALASRDSDGSRFTYDSCGCSN